MPKGTSKVIVDAERNRRTLEKQANQLPWFGGGASSKSAKRVPNTASKVKMRGVTLHQGGLRAVGCRDTHAILFICLCRVNSNGTKRIPKATNMKPKGCQKRPTLNQKGAKINKSCSKIKPWGRSKF